MGAKIQEQEKPDCFGMFDTDEEPCRACGAASGCSDETLRREAKGAEALGDSLDAEGGDEIADALDELEAEVTETEKAEAVDAEDIAEAEAVEAEAVEEEEPEPTPEPKVEERDSVLSADDAELLADDDNARELEAAVGTTLKDEMRIIKKLRRNLEINGYEIGVRLSRIKDQELYKEGGVHKNFSAFCKKAVEFTRAQAYNLIGIATNFTPEDVANIGNTKLRLVLRLPEPADGKLYRDEYAEVFNGIESATTRDLEKAIKALREARGLVDKRNKRQKNTVAIGDLNGVNGTVKLEDGTAVILTGKGISVRITLTGKDKVKYTFERE